MANSVLAKMAVQISANTAEFNKALTSTSNNLKSFTSNIQNVAGVVGVAFGVQQVLQFGLEVSKLAGQSEAVGAAFNRLADSERLMMRLKDATHNTVSELELMKRAVMASNFDISLEALPRLLEFATLRAQQTGQSVDYLVDSIVTGIGRKSKLILDNLGISAAQLSEQLNGVSTEAATVGQVADAVGRIAENSLKNMGEFSINTASKLDQLAASWENLKVQIGKGANDTGIFSDAIDYLRLSMLELTDDYEKFLNSGAAPNRLTATTGDLLSAFEKWQKLLANTTPLGPKLGFDEPWLKVAKESVLTIGILESKIKDLNDSYKNIDITKTNELIQNRRLVKSYEEQIEALKKLGDEKLKIVDIPTFGSSLSRANLEIKDKSFDREQGVMKGLGALDPPDISRFEETANKVKTINQELAESWDDLAASAIVGIAEAFGGGENIGQNLLRSLANFGKRFGAQIVAIGTAKVAEGIMTKNPKAVAEGFKGIAAGAALVGVSAALGSSASGGSSSAGAGGSGISRGGSSGSTLATNAAQNEFSVETAIRGQDLYVVLSNYEKNKGRTSTIRG